METESFSDCTKRSLPDTYLTMMLGRRQKKHYECKEKRIVALTAERFLEMLHVDDHSLAGAAVLV